jgi:membrane protein
MLAYFDTTLGWGELLKRTYKETQADNGLGLAAQLAYYFFLALFPALLFLVALAGVFASPQMVSRLVDMMSGAAPPDVVNIIREQLISLSGGNQGGIMTFGVVAALWSSSAAMVALTDSLNRAYDVEEARPWWKQRLTAILLTLGVALFILISFALVVAGPQLAESLAGRFGLGAAFEWGWKILQWPIIFALVATAIGLVYYFAPDVDQDFVFLTPGSVLATALWLLGSLGFRFYVVNFGSYNETYGTIGGVMVLLLWLYISALVVIIGAEMNAEIEHASEHGKAPGEKQPGGRKTIGARAAREFREKHQKGRLPGTSEAPVTIRPRPSPTAAFARAGVLFGGIVAALFGRRINQ